MPYADPSSPESKERARAASKRYYEKNKEKEKARSAKWLSDNMDRVKELSVLRRSTKLSVAQVLYNNAKARAKAKSIPFSISVSDIIVPEVCPVLGMKLVVNTGSCRDNSPSLDRIIPELGYIVGNISVISHKANTIKSNGTIRDLECVLSYLRGVSDVSTWH